MKTTLLIAGATSIAFAASQVVAQPAPASPKAPIPYSQLNAYLKATPKQRTAKDWWSSAQTGTSTDTSVTALVTPNLPGDTNVNPPPATTSAGPTSTTVNPLPGGAPSATAPGSPPASTPPK